MTVLIAGRYEHCMSYARLNRVFKWRWVRTEEDLRGLQEKELIMIGCCGVDQDLVRFANEQGMEVRVVP